MADMICLIAIDKEDEVTIFYSHSYCRAAQERDKIVLKYKSAFCRFMDKDKMKNAKEAIVKNARRRKINSQNQLITGSSGLSPNSLVNKNIADHQRLCSLSQNDFADFTSNGTQSSDQSAPSQKELYSSSDCSRVNTESAPSQNTNTQHADSDIQFVFEQPPPRTEFENDEAELDDFLNSTNEFFDEPATNEINRVSPLENDLIDQVNTKEVNSKKVNSKKVNSKQKVEHFELDQKRNCIEIFTETRSQRYQIEKKSDNPDLFEKLWMADDKAGRDKQFDEIMRSKFDLFQKIRDGNGSGLVFIPFEEVFDKTKQMNCATYWKNAMGKDVKAPLPKPLCLIIFDRSKRVPYTGEFNYKSTKNFKNIFQVELYAVSNILIPRTRERFRTIKLSSLSNTAILSITAACSALNV